jgi:dipeptidyl aminopeptidase/acylaminoacyl peptidase
MRRGLQWACGVITTLWASLAWAAPLEIEKAFEPAQVEAMALSPDGTHVLAQMAKGDWTVIVLVETEGYTSRVLVPAALGRDAPWSAHWVGDALVAVQYRWGVEFFDLTGKRTRQLGHRFMRTLPKDKRGDQYALVTRWNSNYFIDRMNVRTGDVELTNYDIPAGEPFGWMHGNDGVARVVSTYSAAFWSDDTTVTHWYRAREEDKWRRLADFPFLKVEWWPHLLSADGKTLVVSSTSGRDTSAFFRYDVEAGQLGDMLAGHPTEDISVWPRSETDFPLVATLGLMPRLHWFDAKWQGLQDAVDKALPGRVNVLTGRPDGKVLIYTYGDIDPGRYLVLDAKTRRMREVGAVRPSLDGAALRPMRTVSYPSLDGLTIPAYLTLPEGPGRNLPAIVLIHGGPVARDEWGYDAEVQLLASRGYAVLQPQFRGSDGFGKRFKELGYGQWGLSMQDDVTAGARWLVDQGIADPSRMCIYGGSYGGYAALWALVKTPDLFRCGASFAGVSDLNYMFRDDSDANDSPLTRLLRRQWAGDPRTKAQELAAVSPLEHAQRIKAPVLLSHGTLDGRVPIEHSEKMLAALRRHDKAVEWLPLEGSGHGVGGLEATKRYYTALLAFFAKHIGVAPTVPPPAIAKP